MVRTSRRAGWVSGWFTAGTIVALALVGAGCSSSSDDGNGGEHLLVRTASGGTTDVADTAWSQCYANEPSTGMSRLTTFSFGAGTFTLTNAVFTASVTCTGSTDPAQALTATAHTTAEGDRLATWDGATPPGLATTVTATAVLLSGSTGSGLPDPMRTLFFVNDLGARHALHMGGKDAPPGGYPASLETTGRLRATP